MRLSFPLRTASLWVLCLIGQPAFTLAEETGTANPQTADPAALASEVKESLRGFGAAFAKKDAPALAQYWTEDATYTDADSKISLRGRAEIEAHYAALFDEFPKASLQAEITHVAEDGENLALIRGTANLTSNEEITPSSFVAELKKVGGRWLLAAVEETPPDPLDDLDWLVGFWQDDIEDRLVTSEVTWDESGRFLIRSFRIQQSDETEKTGTEYIAWDANRQEIRSWAFNSEGSIGEGHWTMNEQRWSIHWTITLPGGKLATATQSITPIDHDSYRVAWSAIDVDGEMRPSIEPVTVLRVGEDAPLATEESPSE